MMMNLNLCDIDLRQRDETTLMQLITRCEQHKQTEFDRLFVGSYFCGRYFLHFRKHHLDAVKRIAEKKSVRLVLVVPIFSQELLEKGKQAVREAIHTLSGYIDAVTVNDLGMLVWIARTFRLPVLLGRLFAKDARDFRYEELRIRERIPTLLSGTYQLLTRQYPCIAGAELDNIYRSDALPGDIPISMHVPYVYQSVGHLCPYANMESSGFGPFTANRSCSFSCMRNLLEYYNEDEAVVRVGRAAFYRETAAEKFGSNVTPVYWPLDLWNDENEDISTPSIF